MSVCLSTLGWPLGIWHTCFRKTDKFIGKDKAFVKDWLVHQGLEKLVDVFILKACSLNFRYFFITCKHINISDKVNYILFITKQSLTWTLRGHDYFAFCIKTSLHESGVKILKVYEFKWSDLQDRSCELTILKTNGFYTRKYLMTRNLLVKC